MRSSTPLRLLALSLSIFPAVFGDRLESPADTLSLPRRAQAEAPSPGTVFNSIPVPGLDIAGTDLDARIKTGYHLIEYWSPYCGHCKAFAPTWQTLYEFYYTQAVPQSAPPSAEKATFSTYYDLHFGKMDCIANADTCANREINSYPMVALYKDGELVKKSTGAKDLKTMSSWVEEILESIRPGTRPKGGPKLPRLGADHADPIVLPELPPTAADSEDGTATTSAPSTSSRSAAKLSAKATPTPNPAGQSTVLTAETFQSLVTTTNTPWFIKFHVPWCTHCQALAPTWRAMSRQMRGQLNIGEVNCETEKRLCKSLGVRGYPTTKFFRGGEVIDYDGLRGLGDLLAFANKAVAVSTGVREVTATEFEELEKEEEVIFLYFHDHATTTEDFAALERLVLPLIGHAILVKSSDPLLSTRFKISTWPRLLVSRDGKPTYYTALSPRDMRDVPRVLSWMQSTWLPIVPELTASNAREVMSSGKLVVLAILSRERKEAFVESRREIKNAALEWLDKQTQAFQLERQELRDAKQLRIEEAEDRNDQRGLRGAKSIRINMDDISRPEVGFAWVDGMFWERWIRTTFGISVAGDGERVVMYDADRHRYWDQTATGNSIVPSRTSILETLPRVVSSPPKIQSKSTASAMGHVWWTLRGQVLEHPIVSAAIAFVALVGTLVLLRRHGRVGEKFGATAGYFRVGEKGGAMDGLLGGSSTSPTGGGGQGKVD